MSRCGIDDIELDKPIPDAVPVGKLIVPIIERLGVAFELNQYTESPIETILGAELILGSGEFSGLRFIPQYPWRRYRIDWAALVVATDAPALFIECDGRDFHTSESQVAKDRARDKECADAGIKVLRFTGADINRNAALCALEVFRQLRESGCR